MQRTFGNEENFLIFLSTNFFNVIGWKFLLRKYSQMEVGTGIWYINPK